MVREVLDDDGLLVLTLNRPERRNALDSQGFLDLRAALERAAETPAVRAVMLRGEGNAFCAGGDVKGMAGARSKSVDEDIRDLRYKMEAARLLHEMPKPTIAAIDGVAAGAGLSLALACDLRVASTTARMITSFIKVALPGDFGGAYFLTRLVGSAKARELFFTSRVLGANEALSLGIVSEIYEQDRFESKSLEFARSLANGPATALSLMKENLNLALNAPLAICLDKEAQNLIHARHTADHKEGVQAFLEKRSPKYR